jgi:hypothetical protein
MFATALVVLALAAPPAHAAGTRVTGQVVDAETLAPIAGADVELQNSGGGPGYHRTRSDAKGEFVIENVQTNRWYLFTVGADGYTDWALEGWRFPVTQKEVRIVAPLDRAGRLAVTVTGADGRTPVGSARVTIRSERASAWYEASRHDPDPRWTGKDGTVTFDGLAAGYWTMSVEAGGLRSNEAHRVPVRRGETTPAALTMTKPSSLSGFVRLADSTGVAGVSVIARGATEATATTDVSGAFMLGELAPGRYRVEVSHDGVEPGAAREVAALREGEAREVSSLVVTPRAPALSLVLQREVFAPDEKQQVGVRAFRVARVDFTLWRMPAALLLDGTRDFRATYVQGADTTGLVRVQAWAHEMPDGPPFSWREEDMALPAEQPAGVYVLEARAGKLARRIVFFVSDLSLLAKRSATKTVLWAGSLKTGLPLNDVALFRVPPQQPGGYLENGQRWADVLAQARSERSVTDADGLVTVASDRANRTRWLAVSEKHGVAIVESPLSGEAQGGGDRLFLFTERPIYRPGQTVYWKLFSRQAQGEGWAMPPASTPVSLRLAGPDNASIEIGGASLSAGGSADGNVVIPADSPLGDWTLSASAGRASGSAVVAIQEYRKPEYKVEVTPDREVYVNGDEVRFALAADYFFGAPVVGASVRWMLFETRIREADEWESGEEPEGFGRMLESGEARTDVDGRVQLSFTPQRVAYDRKLSLEVEVVDASQRVVSSRGTALVGRGLFTVHLAPVSGLFLAGQAVQVDVSTKDLLGKPVSAAVTVELDQDAWNPLEHRYTRASRPIASVEAVTSAALGTTRVTIAPARARSGYFTVRARARDERGNTLGDETQFWWYDDRVWSYPYRYPSLEVLPDQRRYAPGDTARLLVNTDVKDASVLVSVEGRELYELRVQHLFGNSGLVKIPIRPEYAPNVYVALHVRRGREVHSRVLELAVAAERHDLAITLTPDRAQYRPREEAKIAVETKDGAGHPVAAELALGVVDESIYSLRADATPNPHDIFYGRRPNWVTTVVSFPTLYYGGADKGDRGEVRRDFRDVALWEPNVRTGPDGRASVTVKWPDNLTTWRATARGVSDATLVGTAIAKTLVTKDVVARLAVPRSFTAGDEVTLVSVVNNRSGVPQTGMTESVAASGAAKLTGPASATTSMAGNGESRSRWTATIAPESPRDGSDARASFLFRVRAKADADALELPVPVRPRAVALHPHGAGAVSGSAQTVSVTLPADLVKSGSSLTLELSPSPAAMVLAASEHLAAYPYGCTEQTANAILPATALLQAAKRAGVTVPGWEDPDRRLGAFLDHLGSLRHDDGAWGWWRSDDSDPYLTTLALDAFAHAALAGVRRGQCVSKIQQGSWALGRILADMRSVDGEAYCAMHLSTMFQLDEAKNWNDARTMVQALARSAYDQRDRLGTSGLGCAAIACARMGLGTEAQALYTLLARRGVADGNGLSFPPDDLDAWFGDPVENTGYALSALCAVAPGDGHALDIVRWLAARRTGRGWKSTRVSGVAAIGLADYLAARPGEFTGASRAHATWNGEVIHDGPLGAATGFGAGVTVRVPGAKLKPGANELVVARAGTGALHWAWSADANVPSPGPVVKESRLAVKREYLRATRTSDRRGRPRWLVSPFESFGQKDPLHVGDAVMVRLTLSAPKNLSWLLVEDPKPSGFEIDQVLPEGADRPYGLWGESRDDRAVFFVRSAEAGDTVIEYLLRPELEGAFTALPTSAGAMYDPDLLVRGPEARLRVAPMP